MHSMCWTLISSLALWSGYHHVTQEETGFEVNLLKFSWLGIGRGRNNPRLALSYSQTLKQPRDRPKGCTSQAFVIRGIRQFWIQSQGCNASLAFRGLMPSSYEETRAELAGLSKNENKAKQGPFGNFVIIMQGAEKEGAVNWNGSACKWNAATWWNWLYRT